jgi:aryl carrier-like protein
MSNQSVLPSWSCLSLRDQLVVLIDELGLPLEDGELQDDTSLIKSGLVDSLALVALAEWIDQAIGTPVDLTVVDLADEWDTIPDILSFIVAHRQGSGPSDAGGAQG